MQCWNRSYAKNNPKARQAEHANYASKKDITCKHCKLKGHLKSDCRAKQHTCTKCGQVGHFEKRCKTKSQDKQKVTNESKKKDTDDTHQTTYAFSIGTSNKRWIVDTGATTSISPHTMPERPTPGESITMANGDTILVTGVTRAKIVIPITTVLCVPEAYRSLLSIGKACEDGDIDSATFNVHGCKL